MEPDELLASLPRALTSYPDRPGASLGHVLFDRAQLEPFNAIATLVFVLAIVHTFIASRFSRRAQQIQRAKDELADAANVPRAPSVTAEVLHFLGEVEVVFGLWAVALLVAMVLYAGWEPATHYFNDTVNYTEPVFVFVIMSLAATRPIIGLSETILRRVANVGGATPAAWWATILVIGPLLGSFITEPAAMTIAALLLARRFYNLQPGRALRYATLGLLFVNVSIGGTLTHFAAPPVLMVARPWGWDLAFMLTTFGWKAVIAIALSTAVYYGLFRRELAALADRPRVSEVEVREDADATGQQPWLAVPAWLTFLHVGFMAWTVATAHEPALFLGGFLIFLGLAKATVIYQTEIDLKAPLLVGFFLAGLVIHGGLQGWWIAPILASLSAIPLFLGAAVLTAFNDNAMITYLATLVPSFDEPLKIAVTSGAVVGGGLTVIANAPNPAGQALLNRFFGGAVSPVGLLLGAGVPTIIAGLVFGIL